MGLIIGVIIAVVVVIILLFLWGSYNGLVNARNLVKNAWAQIDVQLKRRYDLIPNLVETVKGYKNFERETLEAVTKARTAAQTASTMQRRCNCPGSWAPQPASSR